MPRPEPTPSSEALTVEEHDEAVGADERRAKLERLRADGVDPYPVPEDGRAAHSIADIQAGA